MSNTKGMYKFFTAAFLCLSIGSFAQKINKYDSTLKIGKAGFKVTCLNRKPEVNMLSIKPVGFKNEAGEVMREIKGRVLSCEIDDLNNDNFPDIIIYIVDAGGRIIPFTVSSKDNEYMQPILFPDITNDMQLSKGYRGNDEYKLVEGILFRKFPIYDADTAIKAPTKKARQIMYRVVAGERGMLNFKVFKNFDLNVD
jgi:hypothetical protein